MLPKLKASLTSAYNTLITRKYFNLGLLVISLLMWYFVGFEATFFVCLLLVCIINNFSTKILVIGALTFLISIPLFLIFEESTLAEQMAVYVYYLLVSTVILEIITYLRIRKQAPTSELPITEDEAFQPILVQNPTLSLPSRAVSLEFVRQKRPHQYLPSHSTII
jgi:hypothetical protein